MMSLANMISTLTDADDRAIMRLYYLNGHTVRAIAEALDMAERTVYRHLKHAKQELRTMYPDGYTCDQRP